MDDRHSEENSPRIGAVVLAMDFGSNPLCVMPDNPGGDIVICTGADQAPAPRPLQLFDGEPLICCTVSTLSDAGIPNIRVLCACADERDVLARTLEGRVLDGDVICVDDADGLRGRLAIDRICADSDAPGSADASPAGCAIGCKHPVEIFGMSADVLSCANDLARACNLDGILVIPCDLANFNSMHAKRMIGEFAAHPASQVIASWIAWLNRPPYILRASFLRDACKIGALDQGDILRLDVHEVDFGAEMLSAQPPSTDVESPFFAECTLSALESVRAVMRERAIAAGAPAHNPADESQLSKQMNAAFAGKAPTSSINPSDELLMECARDVLAMLDAELGEDERVELERWDAWAHRNKLDFPIFSVREHARSLVYLDSAATSQRLGCALDAQHRFDAFENANVYRGVYSLSANATDVYNDARATLERHLGARRRSVIYTQNTSTAAALAASAWGERNVRTGDRILVPENEHHSNILPWMLLAERKGASLEFIPIASDGRIDMNAYGRMLDATHAPALVCVAHVTNVLGLVNPVREMADAAHARGARVFVDAAQSFAHMPLDVSKLGCDFLAFSAHKAYGPMGLGGLWASDAALIEMSPISLGGGTVSHVGPDSYTLREGSIAYEQGTPCISQAIGLASAIDYLNRIGFDSIEAHGRAMCRLTLAGLSRFDGVSVLGDHLEEDGASGLISFTQAGIAPKTVASVLGKLGVAVRAGGHCALPLHASMGIIGSIRFSFAVHTTAEDIAAALVALEVARRLYLR